MRVLVVDRLRNIKYGLRNFWRYRKIIWADRDWDYGYLYQLMEFKMRRMSRLQLEYGNSMDAGLLAAQLEEAADMLQRLADDDYCPDEEFTKSLDARDAELKAFCDKFYEESRGWWD